MADVSETTMDPTVSVEPAANVNVSDEAGAERTFSISIAVSAIRCTLTYVLIPWVFPFLGETTGVGPTIGVVIGLAAIVANLFSIRRFHRADHRWKWQMTLLNSAVIGLLVFLVAKDFVSLVG